MKRIVLMFSVLLGFAAHGLDKYSIDSNHASVVFKINHMGFSNVYGMFGDVSGDFYVDEAKPELAKFDVTIKTDSLDTKNPKRDEHLKKPDFFDAKQFPTITFKSTSVKRAGGTSYNVTGNLTMHGVTKPMTIKLTRFRTGLDPMQKSRTGGETDFTVKRSDFGMNFMQGTNMVGDNVDLMISLEGIKQ